MEAVEVPQYFVCPISLEIMKDPVTAPTGITYDRESIERWLFEDRKATCPLTNQPLPADAELTPNHTLRRLIQAWCTCNASRGVDRIPTPRAPVTTAGVLQLLADLATPKLQSDTLRLMATLAADSESNRRCMVQAGVPTRMLSTVVGCHQRNQPNRAEEALTVLHVLRISPDELRPLVEDNHELVESLTWVLRSSVGRDTRNHAILVLRSAIETANAALLERLKPEFFRSVLDFLRSQATPQVTKAALQVLLDACRSGGNRARIAQAGAATELIELELTAPDKRTTELAMGVLDHLCGCAEGRAGVVGHAAGLAVVAKRILRVSPAVDDRAVRILTSVCRYSTTKELLHEMVRVGAVAKLCMVLQSNCSTSVKEKARWVLRLHSNVWRNAPCIAAYLLTRYPNC